MLAFEMLNMLEYPASSPVNHGMRIVVVVADWAEIRLAQKCWYSAKESAAPKRQANAALQIETSLMV
jgi:hypothetical protein